MMIIIMTIIIIRPIYILTLGFGGFDSSIIFILRGGIRRPLGESPESLSQAILVGIMLVGRLGVIHKYNNDNITITNTNTSNNDKTDNVNVHNASGGRQGAAGGAAELLL